MKLAYMGIFIAIAFAAGAFISSPELRAYAANTVFSADIVDGEVKTADLASSAVTKSKLAGNSVDGGKVVDQSLSAADLGPDSVGASELKGISKLIFQKCKSPAMTFPAGGTATIDGCAAIGAAQGDAAIGTVNSGNGCIIVTKVEPGLPAPDIVSYDLKNTCTTSQSPGQLGVSVIVFKIG